MTQQQKRKGMTVVRHEGTAKVVSQLVWLGGPVGRPTVAQQDMIKSIVDIRCQIRKQAESNLIESLASNLMNKTRNKLHQIQVERAAQIGIKPGKVYVQPLLKSKGITLIDM